MTVEELIALGAVFVGGQIDLDNKNIGINTVDGPVLHSGTVLPKTPAAHHKRKTLVLPDPLDKE